MTAVKTSSAPRVAIKRYLPLLVPVAGLVAFFALDLGRYVSFEVLREKGNASIQQRVGMARAFWHNYIHVAKRLECEIEIMRFQPLAASITNQDLKVDRIDAICALEAT